MRNLIYLYEAKDIIKIFDEPFIKKSKVYISPESLKFKENGKKEEKNTSSKKN
jgi:hypothetical protein